MVAGFAALRLTPRAISLKAKATYSIRRACLCRKKQTAVYQIADDTFRRVDLNLDEIPGRESDTELEGAIPGHEFTEPVRWEDRPSFS